MISEALDAALAELLVRCGAQAVRVVDGQTGTVLGAAGATTEDDVPALARLAVQAGSAAAAGGGLDDLVLATRRSVHVLRAAAVPGSFLHVRLDPARGDLATTRRELASAALPSSALQGTVRTLLPVPRPGPQPGSARGAAADLPVLPAAGGAGQPALAALGPAAPRPRSGELAVRALGPVPDLPRRIPAQASAAQPLRPVGDDGPGPTPPVLRQVWANDVDTLRRLLTALRRPTR